MLRLPNWPKCWWFRPRILIVLPLLECSGKNWFGESNPAAACQGNGFTMTHFICLSTGWVNFRGITGSVLTCIRLYRPGRQQELSRSCLRRTSSWRASWSDSRALLAYSQRSPTLTSCWLTSVEWLLSFTTFLLKCRRMNRGPPSYRYEASWLS